MADVLLVDDSPTVIKYAELVLSGQGHGVRSVDNAERALELLRTFRPAAVLVDYVLPNMNGVEFCKAVRAGNFDPAMALILMSSKAEERLLEPIRHLAGLHFLAKPFEPEELLDILNRALAG